ncbi:MAG: adenosylcobinamide-GDP ribazoletransferase [Corynebacterium sp.]|uniref:adenosylcobinamide-GDP ribazoletransferase n=1 Tax=Corynebacterium sp. TaxID=1720 RepID=UPI0026DD1F6A|nr:adenosylcobinamide-GDP ribazoletransferase [Corynebacterium sp.]MDO5097875.1 adenosylcobinamide-GDP ribazoletransferase [Corynebacterium sp.]
MSDKAHFVPGEHGPAIIEGPLTALSWMTILPVSGASAFDRITGARVMNSLPIVGIIVGVAGALLATALHSISTPGLLIGVLVVAGWQLFNRFMHIDGLADVGDALGSYAEPAKAREILADPHAGLIGMAGALLALVLQIAGIAAIADAGFAPVIAVIPVVGRICTMVGAWRGFSPMKPTGFAALVIGTVSTTAIAAWSLASLFIAAGSLLLASLPVVFGLLGYLCCLIFVIIVAVVLARHCSKRFSGLNGDTCGFITEICTSLCAAVIAIILSAAL